LTQYWLNAQPADLEAFRQQVVVVCDAYRAAPQRLAGEGIHTVCVDEMTGIQALERIASTKPMRPGEVEKREFEYKRHGTQTLIGNFEVATGQVIVCAVQRCWFSVGAIPTRQLLLQPVAIGAVVEATKRPKPSMQRTAQAVLRAGRP
jgi:DDE superfamily endonuclease